MIKEDMKGKGRKMKVYVSKVDLRRFLKVARKNRWGQTVLELWKDKREMRSDWARIHIVELDLNVEQWGKQK